MKFLHISDLHLGKKVEQYDLIKDQEHILGQIVEIAQAEKPDAAISSTEVSRAKRRFIFGIDSSVIWPPIRSRSTSSPETTIRPYE